MARDKNASALYTSINGRSNYHGRTYLWKIALLTEVMALLTMTLIAASMSPSTSLLADQLLVGVETWIARCMHLLYCPGHGLQSSIWPPLLLRCKVADSGAG